LFWVFIILEKEIKKKSHKRRPEWTSSCIRSFQCN